MKRDTLKDIVRHKGEPLTLVFYSKKEFNKFLDGQLTVFDDYKKYYYTIECNESWSWCYFDCKDCKFVDDCIHLNSKIISLRELKLRRILNEKW